MLDAANPDVLSYVRTGARPVVVAVTMSASPKTVSLDLSAAGLHGNTATTLATDTPALDGTQKLKSITLPAFSSWVGQAQ